MKNIFLISFILFSVHAFAQKSAERSQIEPIYIDQIDSVMTKSYERGLFNGNVLVAKNDKIIYQKSFGFTNETKQTLLTDKSIFNIGSIAKEFNAVSIMMLAERGLLNLDDKVSKFNLGLPKWAEKVSIRHLINYASGIPKIESGMNPVSDANAWKVLRSSDSLLFEPGTNYKYDNGNVFLQRRIIEKVSGMSFEEFVIKNIVKPLKMTNSVFDPKFDYKNRTSCYDMDNVRCPEMNFISGWLWVDINDLYKWIEALNSNRLITKESFQTLLNNPYAKDEGGSLGRYYEKEDLQRHNGVSYKFESIFLNDFKNDITIILVSNNLNRVWDLGHIIHNLMLGKDFEIPKKSIYQALRKEAHNDVDKAIETYHLIKNESIKEYSFENPSELNRLGYELLRDKKTESAIKIFSLNIKSFPSLPNPYDSRGEAYFAKTDYLLSKNDYLKVLDLDPTNQNAKNMLLKIEELLKK
ncbi:MAG: serine hydrolase [Flavobacterium sp.]|nr:MAG: serine hydrolase [Flavobacterium sp.]